MASPEGTPLNSGLPELAHIESESPTELYSSDEPISVRESDRFNRWPFAERIARTLAERKDPHSLVAAIYGPWGDGKTSTLNLMKLALAEYDDVICISFNPWYFGSDEQLLRAFFKTLADGLGKSLPTRAEEIGELLQRYGLLLSVASLSFGGGLVQVSPGNALGDLGKTLSTVELDELRSRLEKLLFGTGKRIIVLIDDIDRLDRREIQAMLKVVKLSAGFNHTSYLLAFDDEWVAAAIGERYGEGGASAGRNFLEKIVQVPLHLPRPDQLALRKLAFEGVEEALRIAEITLSQEEADAFMRHFVDGLEPRLSTPRQAKLYGNVLSFALPMLRGEVHSVDHILIEGIRVFYPKLYMVIRDNSEHFLTTGDVGGQRNDDFRQRTKQLISDALIGTGVTEDQIGRRLLEPLFPRLSGTYGNVEYGSDWDKTWENDQRIASRAYFSRYFSYGIPPGDLSDIQIDSFIELVQTAPPEEADEQIQKFANDGALSNFIRKLRARENNLPHQTARTLARTIARNGKCLPRERDMMLSDWTFGQAAVLVGQLMKSIDDQDIRSTAAREIVDAADPLPFANECWRWLRKWNDKPEEARILPKNVEDELAERLVERIEASWAESPLYTTFQRDAPRLFWLWQHHTSPDHVLKLVRDRLNQHPEELDELLDTYVGLAWGMASGLPHRSNFDRSDYDSVTAFLDAEYIVANLRERFGAELDDPYYHHGDDSPLATRFAHQFMFIHNGILAVQNDGDNEANEPL